MRNACSSRDTSSRTCPPRPTVRRRRPLATARRPVVAAGRPARGGVVLRGPAPSETIASRTRSSCSSRAVRSARVRSRRPDVPPRQAAPWPTPGSPRRRSAGSAPWPALPGCVGLAAGFGRDRLADAQFLFEIDRFEPGLFQTRGQSLQFGQLLFGDCQPLGQTVALDAQLVEFLDVPPADRPTRAARPSGVPVRPWPEPAHPATAPTEPAALRARPLARRAGA